MGVVAPQEGDVLRVWESVVLYEPESKQLPDRLLQSTEARPVQSRSLILHRGPDDLGQSVGSVDTVAVRPVPPQQRVLAGGEHDRPQAVPQYQRAGAVVEQEEGALAGVEVWDDSVQVAPNPRNLHLQPLVQDVFQDRESGEN